MSLRDHLLAVRAAAGTLTPAAVVEAATPKAHPLHDRFEWDNKVAGHKYRLVQAAELIRSVKVEFVRPSGDRSTVRQFHVDRSGDADAAYEPIEEIVANPVAYRVLIAQMHREWEAFKARYEHLEEFAQLLAPRAAA